MAFSPPAPTPPPHAPILPYWERALNALVYCQLLPGQMINRRFDLLIAAVIETGLSKIPQEDIFKPVRESLQTWRTLVLEVADRPESAVVLCPQFSESSGQMSSYTFREQDEAMQQFVKLCDFATSLALDESEGKHAPSDAHPSRHVSNFISMAYWAGGSIFGEMLRKATPYISDGELRLIMKDIFGPDPTQTISFDPSWRTNEIESLARSMYDTCDFSEMGLLKQKLRDAGCTDQRILDHCNAGSPHVRGNWVIDKILGNIP